MLSKKYRLKSADILNVVKRGNIKSADGFYVKFILNPNLETSKYSFSVSLKVSKNATERNRIKRIFRAAIYQLEKDKKLPLGSYSFVIKSLNLKDLKSNDLQNIILGLFL